MQEHSCAFTATEEELTVELDKVLANELPTGKFTLKFPSCAAQFVSYVTLLNEE